MGTAADRVDVRVNASIPVVEDGSGETAMTKNISVGGLYLVTEKRWPLGTTVELTIRYNGLNLKISSLVQHLGADGVGFRFQEPSLVVREGVKAILNDTVARLTREGKSAEGLRADLSRRVVWSTDGVRHEGVLRNLSATGAFLETPETVAPSSDVYLYLPNFATTRRGERFTEELRGCIARIAHSDATGVGLEFKNPSEHFLESVVALLAESAPT